MERVQEIWSNGGTAIGGWCSLPSSVAAETVARTGFDYVCVDLQHGVLPEADLAAMIQAVLLGGSTPIVRVPRNEPGIIGRVLDAGAHGVIVPMVDSADEAREAVHAGRYAPDGGRSYGPTMAAPRVDGYLDWARRHTMVIPMIETVQAVDAIDDILAVDGVDAIYAGPADLSLTLGLTPANHDGVAEFDDALRRVVEACTRADVVAGIHANGALAPVRRAAGFRMITAGADLVSMRTGLAQQLGLARAATAATADAGVY